MHGRTSQAACIKQRGFRSGQFFVKTGTDISKLKPPSLRSSLLLGINKNLAINAYLSCNTDGFYVRGKSRFV